MKYKVGDKVRVRKDLVVNSYYGGADFVEEMKSFIGKVVTISKVIGNDYMILEDDGDYVWTNEIFEGLANEAPSITKRINNKHDILNGLFNSDGSVDGEKLMEKLASDSEEAKKKGSHYEKAAMQPLEVMQRIMTTEQFEGFLYGCCLKYLLRKDYKGQRESDEYKARQYAYWLEMVKDGHIINPSKDKVPYDYKYSII
jgi:hypothetical protein